MVKWQGRQVGDMGTHTNPFFYLESESPINYNLVGKSKVNTCTLQKQPRLFCYVVKIRTAILPPTVVPFNVWSLDRQHQQHVKKYRSLGPIPDPLKTTMSA